MTIRKFSAVWLALLAASAAGAAPVRYGPVIGTMQLAGKPTVELGRQPSVAAAVRAARARRLPRDGYALATTPRRVNNGRVAIDALGVVHTLTYTSGSGPMQRPPVAPVVIHR